MFLSGMVFSFVAFEGCADFKLGPEGRGVRIKGGNEILVQRDVTNERPLWCAKRGMLVYSKEDKGVFYYDIKTDRNVNVADRGNVPLACTPDGEWLVYIDKDSLRYDEGSIEREVIDVWRYEFKTKRRQRFAVADYAEVSLIADGVLAPTETRVFLGKQPEERVKMPAPEWDIIRAQKKGGLTVWFHDSTAVLRVYSGEGKDRLLIEVLSPERETIFLEQRAKYILHIVTDRQNRIYMQVSNEEFEPDLINEVIRCTVDLRGEKREGLSCTPVLEDYSVKSFDVLSSGAGFAFMEWRVDGCVRVARTEDVETPCITKASFHPGYHLNISPDDKWLAFMTLREKEDNMFANDLYLVKLKD
jgi:hypothetical protein